MQPSAVGARARLPPVLNIFVKAKLGERDPACKTWNTPDLTWEVAGLRGLRSNLGTQDREIFGVRQRPASCTLRGWRGPAIPVPLGLTAGFASDPLAKTFIPYGISDPRNGRAKTMEFWLQRDAPKS